MKKQHWFIPAGIVAFLVIAAALIIWLDNGHDAPKGIALSTIYHDGKYYPILNGQQNGAPFEYEYYNNATSADGTVACVKTKDEELILFTLTERKTIAQQVSRYFLHRNGSLLFFVSDDVLYQYDVATGTQTTVLSQYEDYAFSPDYGTIAYINASNELILKTGSTEKVVTVLDEKAGLNSLSNGGDHIYITVSQYRDSTLYHYDSNGTSTKILQYESSNIVDSRYFANKAEFFIGTFDGTYVSTNGQPAVKLADYWVQPVYAVNDRDDGMDDLRNWAYWTANGEIWYIADDPANPITLVQDAKTAYCDPSGRYVWYAKDNNLMRLDTLDGVDAEKNAVVIAEDLVDLTVWPPYGSTYRDIFDLDMRFSEDYKQIAYFREKDLYLLDAMNGGEMKLIAEEPTRYNLWLENGMFYYVKENILYSYCDGVSTEITTNVSKISKLNPGSLYAERGDEYYITDGTSSYTLTLSPTG